jgi:hypothetical protein
MKLKYKIIFLGPQFALNEGKSPVILRRINLVAIASAKHAIAGHLDVQLDCFATLSFLGERILDSAVIAT